MSNIDDALLNLSKTSANAKNNLDSLSASNQLPMQDLAYVVGKKKKSFPIMLLASASIAIVIIIVAVNHFNNLALPFKLVDKSLFLTESPQLIATNTIPANTIASTPTTLNKQDNVTTPPPENSASKLMASQSKHDVIATAPRTIPILPVTVAIKVQSKDIKPPSSKPSQQKSTDALNGQTNIINPSMESSAPAIKADQPSHDMLAIVPNTMPITPVKEVVKVQSKDINHPPSLSLHQNSIAAVNVQTGTVKPSKPAPSSIISHRTEPTTANILPSWYQNGWNALASKNLDHAMQYWEDGLRSLAKNNPIIASNSYKSPQYFIYALKRQAKIMPTFGVRQYINGAIEYRVIGISFDGKINLKLPSAQKLYARSRILRAYYLYNSLYHHNQQNGYISTTKHTDYNIQPPTNTAQVQTTMAVKQTRNTHDASQAMESTSDKLHKNNILLDWYQAGWDALASGDLKSAIKHWEGGLRNLPKDRKIIVSNSYKKPSSFITSLHQHLEILPTFGVKQYREGKLEYRIIMISLEKPIDLMLSTVQKLHAQALILNASYLQQRLNNTITKSTAPKKHTIQSQSPLPDMNKSANKNKDTWQTLSSSIQLHLKSGNYAYAAKEALMLTLKYPQRWEGWFWLGTAQLAQGQMTPAQASLEHASKQDPKIAEVWIQRAIVAQENRDQAIAIHLLKKAKLLAPNNPQIYLNLGYSYDALQQNPLAVESYQHYLRLTAGNESHHLIRNSVMERLKLRSQQ